jgi:hypothetical protein
MDASNGQLRGPLDSLRRGAMHSRSDRALQTATL